MGLSPLDDSGHPQDGRGAATHRRIDDIELLRAIAIVFVIIHHSHGSLITWRNRAFDQFHDLFNLGSGVNIFFAVSGFVIARSILPSLVAAHSIRDFTRISLSFWIRRAWRLLPSAWLWLVLIQIAALTFNDSVAFSPPRTNFGAMEAGLLNYANYRFALKFTGDYGASFPYWTLSLEEQFYILFPILVFFFRKYFWIFALVAIAFQFREHSIFLDIYYSSFRTTELLTGVLIAIWATKGGYRQVQEAFARLHPAVIWLLIVALLAALTAATSARLAPFASRYHPSIATCGVIVLIASFNRNLVMPAGAAKRVMMWIGSRSYALYLIHIPAFFLTRELWYRIEPTGTVFGGTFTLRYVLTALLILAVASEANYRFVETPLRLRGAAIADGIRKRMAGPAGSEARHRRVLAAWIVAGWAALVVVADTGRTGLLERVFGRPVPAGRELAAYPLFERLAGQGWGDHESWGIWSIGDHSVINIPLDRSFHGGRRLLLKGHLLLAERHPAGAVTFWANGVEVGRCVATLSHNDVDLAIDLPAQLMDKSPGNLRIDIKVDQPVSPLSLGLAFDGHKMGLGLVSLRLLDNAGS